MKIRKNKLFGYKLGMTRLFLNDWDIIPVSVIYIPENIVIENKNEKTIIGFGDNSTKCNKPHSGVFLSKNLPIKRNIKSISKENNKEVGTDLFLNSYNVGDFIDISGQSKGHGFTGVIKRWNHHCQRRSHGTGPVRRSVGSIGMGTCPGRILKGKDMPGRYGNEKVTIQNLKIVKLIEEERLIFVKGGIPGCNNSIVSICKAIKKESNNG